MYNANSRTAPLPPPDQEVEQADIERTTQQLILVAELADMGMRLARAAFVRAANNPSDAADAAYNRIARAVERALALEAWLLRLRRTRGNQHDARKVHADHAASQSQTRQLRGKLQHAVADTPEFSPAQRFRLERYISDFTQSGDPTRPICEILAEITRDLGIMPAGLASRTSEAPPLGSPGGLHQADAAIGSVPTPNLRPPLPD